MDKMAKYITKESAMNLGTGSLILVGFILLVTGVVSKLIGVPLMMPLIVEGSDFFIAANTCFLIALVIDKFEKR